MADTPFNARNGLVANAAFTANSTQVSLGSNVIITPSTVTILTGTSNVVLNATAVFVGNSTVNSTINSTSVALLTLNTAAQYTWTNTHTFSGAITSTNAATFTSTVAFGTASTIYIGGDMATITLTDAATINWDITTGAHMAGVTLGGNRTFAAPTGIKNGTYTLLIQQDATGSRTITWNSVFKWVQGVPPVLSTGANKVDFITIIAWAGTLYCSFLPDLR